MPLIIIGIGLILISVSASVVLLDQQGSELTASVSEPENCVVPEPVEFPTLELTLTDTENNPVSLTDHLGTVILINPPGQPGAPRVKPRCPISRSITIYIPMMDLSSSESIQERVWKGFLSFRKHSIFLFPFGSIKTKRHLE